MQILESSLSEYPRKAFYSVLSVGEASKVDASVFARSQEASEYKHISEAKLLLHVELFQFFLTNG